MTAPNNSKITTIKLRKETKERLDHLREFERESYDEIMKKVLYILNMLRSNPESARRVLRKIDFKVKRKSSVYQGIPEVKKEKIIENQKQNKFRRLT